MGAVRSKTLIERMGFNDPDLLSPKHDSIVLWIGDHIEEYIARIYDPWRGLDDCKKDAQESILKARGEIDRGIESNAPSIQRYLDRLKANPDCVYTKTELDKANKDGDKLAKRRRQISEWLENPIALPDAPPFPKYATKFEVPVMSGNFIVGFVDVVTTVTTPRLRTRGANWEDSTPPALYFADNPPLSTVIYFEAKVTIPSLGELLRQIRTYQQYVQGRFVVVSPDTRFQRHIESQGIEFWECVL